MFGRRYLSRASAFVVIVLFCLTYEVAAQGYPTGVVTLVIPYPAGTATDTFGRIFARKLESEFGQKVIVENRPGANGMNGSGTFVRAKPDGHTLLFTTSSTHTSILGLYRSVPYDPVKDFTPIGIVYSGSTLLVVRSDLGVESIPQLIAYAKANPGKLNIGFANATGQIAVEVLKRRAAIDVVAVPYRGTPQAMADLLGGSLQLMVADVATAGQLIEANKLKPLAFFSLQRNPVYPQVATYHETIAPGLDLSFWTGVFAPAGTSGDIVNHVAKALNNALDQDEVRDHAKRIGSQISWIGPEDFKAKLPQDIARWNSMISEAGIEPE
ncbi:tripartite tricarboxylate transporter substrate binding protein [Bradyrhizobium sp. LHD-71]|uniref:Bug family tripartite tricarboxylate transporter substrate binding protein n=1 Tax=Bradyrhizobium sp. LHD-71 TaxID=3072141 RepID=UPI00280F8391|nr:tripartite tricarboxylate transporter substrate binding protein [Bradyrhizobium sp. LHD-71]MDQ8728588.1 tripartite tricarboxylate transporter substrate binding protein [Bradyrhizobium sp. LHD-71]